MKTAIITGVTGQVGSYIAELLLEKGYKVIGLKRRTSLINTKRIDHLFDHPNFEVRYFDLNDAGCFYRLFNELTPDEIYHLAAMSHVKVSFEVPENTFDSVVMGILRILNAMKEICPHARLYQASTSEMYGNTGGFLDEESPMKPCSPYAIAKLASHHLVRNYRESYGLHASCGIMFNNESDRRGETFVTRKITIAAAKIKAGKQKKLVLGNIDSMRDWGYTKDYAEAVWIMLQQPTPDDFVIATGESHSVRQFVEKVFLLAGLKVEDHLEINEKYFRPSEVHHLCGNASKAKQKLGWEPKTSFDDLVKMMWEADWNEQKK